jgi:hypothetical protein
MEVETDIIDGIAVSPTLLFYRERHNALNNTLTDIS